MEPREGKAVCAPFIQQAEHLTKPVLGRAGRAFPANGIETPESKKDGDLHPHGGGPGGDDKRRHRAIHVAAQQNDRHLVRFGGLQVCQVPPLDPFARLS